MAARAPAAVGLNVTLIVQLLPEERLDPQLVVFEKSPVFVPEIEIDICLKFELPELLRVIDCEALLVPTTWSVNVRLDGDRFARDLCRYPSAIQLADYRRHCRLPSKLPREFQLRQV